MKPGSTFRIRLLSFAILIFALVLISKLYFLQLVMGGSYSDKAQRQYINPNSGLFSRGSIYFSGKDGDLIPAANLKTGYLLTLNPQLVSDAQSIFQKISSLVTLDKTAFISKAQKKSSVYEEIAKKLPEDIVPKIEALKIPSIKLYQERWRFYPGGSMASNVLGILAYKGNDYGGRYGLESYYEDVLKRDSSTSYVNFFAQVLSNVGTGNNKNVEGDIVTSIEPTVQSQLEKELKGINDKWHSDFSGGIIINPQNGEIYAMAMNPTFDPNNFSSEKNVSIFANPMVNSVYEMGSIFKPLTMAAGIDFGSVKPYTTYNDSGSVTLNGSTISNYDHKGRGVVSMQEVLNQSLNTGAVFVATKMGRTNFEKYMLSYGLGDETGIDLPNEASGLVKNLSSNIDVDSATVSFGQGVAVTPIETVRALSSLGNGGLLINPHIVTRVNYLGGMFKTVSFPPEKRVLKKETSDAITKMLVTVVDKALRNGQAKNLHYSIAAKTGTAQIVDPSTGHYYPDRYLHSFFGYFPAYNPKFLVFFYTYYPKNVSYASETLTDSFIDITNFLLNYYEIPPDR